MRLGFPTLPCLSHLMDGIMNRHTTGYLVGLAALVGCLAGCVGWDNWPPVKGNTAFNNPNAPAPSGVMEASMAWFALKFPPADGSSVMTVNLPEPTDSATYRAVAKAANANPVSRTSDNPGARTAATGKCASTVSPVHAVSAFGL